MYKLSNLIQNQLMFIGQPPTTSPSNPGIIYHGSYTPTQQAPTQHQHLDEVELVHQHKSHPVGLIDEKKSAAVIPTVAAILPAKKSVPNMPALADSPLVVNKNLHITAINP